MEDSIKSAIRQARSTLDKLDEVFNGFVDELPEQAQDVQKRSKVVIKNIREQLDKAADKAEISAEEAQLQAHLGLMEAKDRIEASRPVIEEYLKSAADKTQTAMDEAELKAKLAAMEAEDFWERRGKAMAEEFKQSAEKMASVAKEASTDLQTRLERWAQTFDR